jgi:hypothetical protein
LPQGKQLWNKEYKFIFSKAYLPPMKQIYLKKIIFDTCEASVISIKFVMTDYVKLMNMFLRDIYWLKKIIIYLRSYWLSFQDTAVQNSIKLGLSTCFSLSYPTTLLKPTPQLQSVHTQKVNYNYVCLWTKYDPSSYCFKGTTDTKNSNMLHKSHKFYL